MMGLAHKGVFMKKLTVVLLIALLAMTAVFAQSGSETATTASKATKIGFVVINDESDQGYPGTSSTEWKLHSQS